MTYLKPNLSPLNANLTLSLVPYRTTSMFTMVTYVVSIKAKLHMTYGDSHYSGIITGCLNVNWVLKVTRKFHVINFHKNVLAGSYLIANIIN